MPGLRERFRPKRIAFRDRWRSLLAHAAVGLGVWVLTGLFFGYLGGLVALIVVLGLGIIWEYLTPELAEIYNWKHAFGDLADVVAFVAGPVLAELVRIL